MSRSDLDTLTKLDMKNISFILNIPWTLIGILMVVVLIYKSVLVKISDKTFVLIVQRLWINEIFLRRKVNGFAIGNVVLLSTKYSDNIYRHELVHINQFQKYPLIFPFLYCIEFLKKGYYNNKYEIEAREKTNNI